MADEENSSWIVASNSPTARDDEDVFNMFFDEEMYYADPNRDMSAPVHTSGAGIQSHSAQETENGDTVNTSSVNIPAIQASSGFDETIACSATNPTSQSGQGTEEQESTVCVFCGHFSQHANDCVLHPNWLEYQSSRVLESSLSNITKEPVLGSQMIPNLLNEIGAGDDQYNMGEKDLESNAALSPVWKVETALYGQQDEDAPIPEQLDTVPRLPVESESEYSPGEMFDANGDVDVTPEIRAKQPALSPVLISKASRSGTYTAYFKTFSDAENYLHPPQQLSIPKSGPTDDDWRSVKGEDLQSYCRRLYEALSATPSGPPDSFPGYAQDYHTSHQQSVFNSIRGTLRMHPLIVEARVMMVMKEIVKIHEEGVPNEIYLRRSKKHGYKLECGFMCSQRANTVIAAAQDNKYVADDIINGNGLQDLARSPNQYARRKVENARVNAKKAHQRNFKRKERDESSDESDGNIGRKRVKTESNFYTRTANEEHEEGQVQTPSPSEREAISSPEIITRIARPLKQANRRRIQETPSAAMLSDLRQSGSGVSVVGDGSEGGSVAEQDAEQGAFGGNVAALEAGVKHFGGEYDVQDDDGDVQYGEFDDNSAVHGDAA